MNAMLTDHCENPNHLATDTSHTMPIGTYCYNG